MTDHVLGIDLGTTNSVVAVAHGGRVRVLSDEEGRELIPSMVSFHPTGDVLVGHAARDRRLLDAKNTVSSVKRLIGRPFGSDEVKRAMRRFPFDIVESSSGGTMVETRGEQYALSEISAFVLREVRRVAEARLGKRCTRAVVTVPANFNDLQRNATKAAGRVAGLEVLRVLNEPTAAALAYGYGSGTQERIAIFDLGGGTFDVTILQLAGEVFEVVSTAGDSYLGGDDVDLAVADSMADAFLSHHRFDPRQDAQSFERLRAAAEWAKCELSAQDEVELRVEELAYGEGGQSLDLNFTLSKRALDQIARPLIARAFDVCEQAMKTAGVRPTQLDNVILVGGSTRMPLVRQMVAEYFGKQPLTDIDPDVVVAQGAAIQGAALATDRRARLAKVSLRKVEAVRVNAGGLSVPGAYVPGLSDGAAPEPAGYRPAAPASFQARAPAGSENLPPRPPQVAARTRRPAADGTEELDLMELVEMPSPAVVVQSTRSVGTPRPRGPATPAPFDMPTLESEPPPPKRPSFAGAPMPPGIEDLAPLPDDQRAGPAPLLLDVTPQSLGVETVGGFCNHVIERNSPIPVEQTREFSTGQDDQTFISVRICQGESKTLDDNQLLGAVELDGIRAAARGSVRIGVTFVIDSDGALSVTARDGDTGREQRVRIRRIGEIPEDQLDQLQARLEAKFRPGGALAEVEPDGPGAP